MDLSIFDIVLVKKKKKKKKNVWNAPVKFELQQTLQVV